MRLQKTLTRLLATRPFLCSRHHLLHQLPYLHDGVLHPAVPVSAPTPLPTDSVSSLPDCGKGDLVTGLSNADLYGLLKKCCGTDGHVTLFAALPTKPAQLGGLAELVAAVDTGKDAFLQFATQHPCLVAFLSKEMCEASGQQCGEIEFGLS